MQWFPKTKLGKVNLALVILLLISLGCFLFLINLNQPGQSFAGAVKKVSQDDKNQKKNNVNNVDVKTEKSPFEGITYTTETSKMDHYTLMYPKTGISAVDDVIQQSVYAKRDDFLSSETKKLVMSIKASTSTNYVTFVLKQKELLANREVSMTIQTFTYDQKSHELIGIKKIVQNKERLNRLSKETRHQLQRKNQHAHIDAKKIDALTDPKWTNFSTFALDGANIKIYYQPNMFTKDLTAVAVPMAALDKKYDTPVFDLKTNGKKYIALTFDDGPSKKVTPRVLSILKKHKAKATFYMLGKSVEEAPTTAKAVAKAGHEIGNHSYQHANLSKMTSAQAYADITKTNNIIKKQTGAEPLTIRPPYGARNHGLEKQLSQPTILWSIDTLDWKTLNPAATLAQIKQHAYPGAIVLMHDIHPTTADALDSVLTYLEQQGYQFVTISQLEGKQ